MKQESKRPVTNKLPAFFMIEDSIKQSILKKRKYNANVCIFN